MPRGTVAYWRFDRTGLAVAGTDGAPVPAGTVARDLTGNGNDLEAQLLHDSAAEVLTWSADHHATAPAHASLRAVRRRVGASRASAHKLRAPERLCHKSDTICSGGDVGPRLDAKPTRILAAWRPWRNGSRPGRITWGARARAIGAHAGGSTPPKAIVRGDCKEGLFASGVPLLVRGGRRRRTKCCSRGMPPGPGLDPEKNAALPRLRRGTQDDA